MAKSKTHATNTATQAAARVLVATQNTYTYTDVHGVVHEYRLVDFSTEWTVQQEANIADDVRVLLDDGITKHLQTLIDSQNANGITADLIGAGIGLRMLLAKQQHAVSRILAHIVVPTGNSMITLEQRITHVASMPPNQKVEFLTIFFTNMLVGLLGT